MAETIMEIKVDEGYPASVVITDAVARDAWGLMVEAANVILGARCLPCKEAEVQRRTLQEIIGVAVSILTDALNTLQETKDDSDESDCVETD